LVVHAEPKKRIKWTEAQCTQLSKAARGVADRRDEGVLRERYLASVDNPDPDVAYLFRRIINEVYGLRMYDRNEIVGLVYHNCVMGSYDIYE
jgi:hypothetical protein